MIALALRSVRREWRRSAATALTVLLAVVSFVVLTASAQTSKLVTTGTVNANFRASYDVLVRPPWSRTPQETASGRVRPNYLSGLFGGITLAQAKTVAAVPGVEVSAPVAMVGEVFETVDLNVDVTPYVNASGPTLLRFDSLISSTRGVSRTPGKSGYLYVGDHLSLDPNGDLPSVQQTRADGNPASVCPAPPSSPTSPFEAAVLFEPQCWDRDAGVGGFTWPGRQGQFLVQVPVSFPVMVAAVDPVAEDRLTGLNGALVNGEALSPTLGASAPDKGGQSKVPVLASTKTFVDETTAITVEKLPPAAADTVAAGTTFEKSRVLVSGTTGTIVAKASFTGAQAHDLWLQGQGPGASTIYPRILFQPSSVSYTGTTDTTLVPRTVTVPAGIWAENAIVNEPFAAVSPTAADTGYRGITPIPAQAGLHIGLEKVGSFDPTRLTRQSALTEVPLETYQPPVADPADAATEQALQGTLLPDTNPAGYLQSPPLLLTNLASLPAFADPRNFALPPGSTAAAAPISAVRVRIAGVTGADPVSRERIRLAAERIQAATGLQVDVTAGSSPAPTEVALPKTAHGAPALNVTERWTQKGVAAAIITAIDQKSLTLFILILAATALAVAISAQAAVRARRVELAVMACIGWRPGTLLRQVLTELTVIGLLGGVAGALFSWPVAQVTGIEIPAWRSVLAIPAALLLTFVAGLVPAVLAGRSAPVAAVRPPASPRSRVTIRLRGPVTLAAAYLLRTPGRVAAGAASLALGVTTLATLTGILTSFQGAVVGSLLGNAVSVQVRGPDIIAAVLLTLIGLGSLTNILYLDIREQGPRYASLQATGWRDRTLMTLIVWQALLIAAVGAALGTLLSILLLSVLTPITGALVGTVAVVALAGIAVAGLISLAPAASLRRLRTAELLARD